MRRVTLLLLCAALAACAKTDKSPPPAPVLEPLPATTELSTLHLTGTAQYASLISITRTPAFGAGAPTGVTADAYTAHFEADLPLALGVNTFSVTAANKNGPGLPATVTVTRNAAKPHTLQLTLDERIVAADQGTLIARAHIQNPEAIPLDGFEIDFTATPGGSPDGGSGAVTVSAKTDAAGIAVATLTGLSTEGQWSLQAQSKDDPDATDSALFVVQGGAPSSLSLSLAPVGADAGPGSSSVTVLAGTDVQATIVVRDQPNNVLSVPFTLFTDAPGAIIAGSTITHLDVASPTPYRVVASIPATSATGGQVLTAEATILVQAGGPSTISVTLPKSTVQSGEAIIPVVVEKDAVGNPIPNANPSLQWSPAAASFDATSGAYTFGAAGSYTLTATDLQNPSITGSATLTVVHGPAATLTLNLGASSVQAVGTDTWTATVLDAAGNVIPPSDALVSVVTDAPGAIVSPGQLSNLSRAGNYTVYAQVTGTNIADSKPLTVTAGPTTTVHLTLSSFTAAVNYPVPYSVTVLDASGNPTGGAVSITSSAPAGTATVDTTNQTIAHSQPGTFTITAQALDASGNPIAGAVDRQSLTVAIPADLTPPSNVAVDAPAQGAIVAPGTTLTVQVQAQDNVSLSTVRFQARGALGTVACDDFLLEPTGTTCVGVPGVAGCAAIATFSCRIPGNAAAGTVSIVGAATDTAGNTTVSAPVTVTVDLAGTLTLSPGITATTVAARGQINAPLGVIADANNIYVANGGSANVLAISRSTGAVSVVAGPFVARPFDLALDTTNNVLFVTLQNTGRIERVPLSGATITDAVNVGGCSAFESLAFDPTILPGTLLAADQATPAIGFWQSTSNSTTCPTGASADTWNGRLNAPFGVTQRTSGVAGDVEVFAGDDGTNRILRRLLTASSKTWSATTYSNGSMIDDLTAGGGGGCQGQGGNFPACQPRFIKMSASGKLYASNWGGDGVTSFTLPTSPTASCSPNGCVDSTLVVGNLGQPAGLWLIDATHMLVVDNARDAVFMLTRTSGTF